MERDFIANIYSVLTVTLSMVGNMNEIITGIVLLSAFGLNIARIIEIIKNKNKQN
jgi:hypothetical protein